MDFLFLGKSIKQKKLVSVKIFFPNHSHEKREKNSTRHDFYITGLIILSFFRGSKWNYVYKKNLVRKPETLKLIDNAIAIDFFKENRTLIYLKNKKIEINFLSKPDDCVKCKEDQCCDPSIEEVYIQLILPETIFLKIKKIIKKIFPTIVISY